MDEHRARMTLDEAKKIYKAMTPQYVSIEDGDKTVLLDGHFTADELEAIAVLMREGKIGIDW
jgi:hypothetical protein